jgi:pimeloyl-ACP methyl ester carboxylesterase
MTWENLTADADALREKLGFERRAVLGHSFGGHVAQPLDCLGKPAGGTTLADPTSRGSSCGRLAPVRRAAPGFVPPRGTVIGNSFPVLSWWGN